MTVQATPLQFDLPNLKRDLSSRHDVTVVALGSSTMAGEGGIVALP
jgi:hypothetical protein